MESSPSPELVANPTIATEMQGMAGNLRNYLLRNPSAAHPLSERVPLGTKDTVWFLETGQDAFSLKINLHDESGKEIRELNYYYSADLATEPLNGIPYEITDDSQTRALTEADIPAVLAVADRVHSITEAISG